MSLSLSLSLPLVVLLLSHIVSFYLGRGISFQPKLLVYGFGQELWHGFINIDPSSLYRAVGSFFLPQIFFLPLSLSLFLYPFLSLLPLPFLPNMIYFHPILLLDLYTMAGSAGIICRVSTSIGIHLNRNPFSSNLPKSKTDSTATASL